MDDLWAKASILKEQIERGYASLGRLYVRRDEISKQLDEVSAGIRLTLAQVSDADKAFNQVVYDILQANGCSKEDSVTLDLANQRIIRKDDDEPLSDS